MKYYIVCQHCDVTFSAKKNLYPHMRRVHGIEPVLRVPSKIKKETCYVCDQSFIQKSNLYRHLRQIHKISTPNEYKKRSLRIICPMDDCSECFRNYHSLRGHLAEAHTIEVELDEFQFTSYSVFEEWKNQIQQHTLSKYIRHTNFVSLLDGTKKEFYNCHRSYNYIPKGKGLRCFQRRETIKIGKACPSRLEVAFSSKDEGVVDVKYWKTHLGHFCDNESGFLGTEDLAAVGELKEDVTFADNDIKYEIFDDSLTNEESQQILVLEKKDLDNIDEEFNFIGFVKNTNVKNIIESPVEVSSNQMDDIKRKAETVIGLCDTSLLTDKELRFVINSFDRIVDVMNKKGVTNFYELQCH